MGELGVRAEIDKPYRDQVGPLPPLLEASARVRDLWFLRPGAEEQLPEAVELCAAVALALLSGDAGIIMCGSSTSSRRRRFFFLAEEALQAAWPRR